MVLLNLDARLKSLPLPFGRSSKNATGTGSGFASKGARAMPADSMSNGVCLKGSRVNGMHAPVSRTMSAESVPTSSWSANIAEALKNHALLGTTMHLACGPMPDTPSLAAEINLSQTLPLSYSFGGSTTSLSSYSPLTTRSQRSLSTTDYKSSRIRRRLTLNPAWKAVS